MRRNHGATFKAQVAELAEQFSVHPTQITEWKQQLLARSTAYYQPTPVSETTLALMRRIDELHLQYPFAGARMLRDLLRQEGHTIGRHQVPHQLSKHQLAAVHVPTSQLNHRKVLVARVASSSRSHHWKQVLPNRSTRCDR